MISSLELELSHMYTELEKGLDNPFSALRTFLQNNPCVVRSLLDNCIVTTESNVDNIESSMGKIVFDFFLFHPDNSGHELALVDLVIATGSDANSNSMIRI